MRPPRSFRSKSLPLVLHESAVDELALPLDMYSPESSSADKMQVEKWVRRSLRLLNPSDSETQTVKNSSNSRKSLKLLHASSLRRSPRLVSPNSETRSCNAKINSSRVSNSSNKSRSRKSDLRVFGDKSLRRSPRLVSSDPGAETGNAELNLGKRKRALVESRRSEGQSLNSDDEEKIMIVECLEEKFVSRSTRLSFTPSRTINSRLKSTLQSISLRSLKSPNKNGCFRGMFSKTSDFKMSSSRELKTNSLSLSWIGDGNKEPEALKFYVPQLYGEKCLRRSPRLISTTENNLSNETLRRCDMGLFDEKPLTYPELSSSFCGAENIEINSTFIELSKSSDVQPSKQIETSLDEKYSSQSRILETSSIGTENCKTNHMLLEFPKSAEKQSAKKIKSPVSPKNKGKNFSNTSFLIGDPIPKEEAQERWRWRYELMSQRSKSKKSTSDDEEDPIVLNVECHHAQATVDNCTFYIGDCAYIKGDEGQKHVGKILEFFKTTDGEEYFRVQWFYRAEDTVMKEEAAFHDKKRLFYSTVENDNLVDCIISKVNIMQMMPRVRSKLRTSLPADFYYDMEYCVEYSTFRTLLTDNFGKTHDLASPDCIDTVPGTASAVFLDNMPGCKSFKTELALLDLYSGCGGMSTGLCLGAKLACANLVTRWALDSNKSACESLKLNHPETYVRNESAKDFLELLKEWEKLCKQYAVNVERKYELRTHASAVAENDIAPMDDEIPGDEYEVSSLVDICYGDPSKTGKHGLKFKVHWKGYDTSEDTWEPVEGLSNCPEKIQDFVRNGLKSKILPLPGDVDVICGGPPCQGISGYNRYRNVESPLEDERNHQIVVFMDIVKFLKPKYVLMENVTDILRFDKASLGRYALSRLVHMNYQARLGIMAAGCYGLPQFRLRVFLWGALPSHKLPQFPMPTHDVIMRYWPPPEFERNTVAYDEDQHRVLENFLEKAVVLQDAISDLPSVTSHETREKMSYDNPPETEFQRYIRSTKYDMTGSTLTGSTLSDSTETKNILYDHRPYSLSEDDYLRVCQIPKRKGANFRDLPGVIVGKDNVVQRGPKETQVLLPSGKPMVPDYAFTFEQGKSKRPFARLWWDETVTTVVTFPSCHNQAALHPEQDRVLTVREYARLQGFPDYYRFCGTVKERYCQVGNAVAVPVARALGYALGMAIRNLSGNEPVMTLPPRFSHSNYLQLAKFLYPENF